MPATAPPLRDRSIQLLEAEQMLRAAGRHLEFVGVCDDEAARMAGVVFRLASRVRSDRLAVAA